MQKRIIVLIALGAWTIISLFITAISGKVAFLNISMVVFCLYTLLLIPSIVSPRFFATEMLKKSDNEVHFGKKLLYTSVLPVMLVGLIFVGTLSYLMIVESFK
ncbi:hypothetical protein AAXB25_14950 [Paenibacillus lautus]|uniref:hypothetical protein n=1 Tax=Paenibacillus lautus TaxID=1401 RepID=UPI003D29A16F